jgi:hypothetical protein
MSTQFPAILDDCAESWYRQLTSPLNALRLVLSIALERNAAADCLGDDTENCLSLWPSSLYGILAAEAARSRAVWERCSQQIEHSLGESGRRFLALPPAALSQMFRDNYQVFNNRELAALLWALLKRGEPMSELMAGRLGAELQVVAVKRMLVAADVTTQSDDAVDPVDDLDELTPYVSCNQVTQENGKQAHAAHRH